MSEQRKSLVPPIVEIAAAYRCERCRLSMRLLGGIYAIAAAKLSKRYLESTIVLKEKPFFLCFLSILHYLCGSYVEERSGSYIACDAYKRTVGTGNADRALSDHHP